MKRRFLSGGVILGVCAALVGAAGVQGAKPGSTDLQLVVNFTNLSTDGVRSDGQTCSEGQYCGGQQNVRAVLLDNSAGNFIFDTNDNARIDGGRRLVLDFHTPSTPFTNPLPVDVFIGTIVVDSSNPIPGDNLRTMTTGQTLQRRTRIGWVDGNTSYAVAWNGPENDGHGFLNIHCDGNDGTSCIQWTVTPGGTAGLYSSPTKGNVTETYYGSYTMPFSATLFKQ
ncbi:MAG: hypothetical protein C5B57_09810 [Blastocatellia bacterium]|nr:MAG: hypothetical protein C5B57_09810 [Blastocatellia bacterium]